MNENNGIYGANYKHHTSREPWSPVIVDLFYKIINPWNTNGIAIAANTFGDKNYPDKPFIRIRDGLEGKLKESLSKGFRREHFDEIFSLAQRKRPDEHDLYKVTRLGLSNNSYVYLIAHADEVSRAMLIIRGPWKPVDLRTKLTTINGILEAETKDEYIQESDDHRQLATRQFRSKVEAFSAPMERLEARANLLEEKGDDNLHYDQRYELEWVQVAILNIKLNRKH